MTNGRAGNPSQSSWLLWLKSGTWGGQPLGKTVRSYLKKLKIELPFDPAIPFLGIYPRELKGGSQNDTCTPMFIAALITVAKRWKQPKLSTDE